MTQTRYHDRAAVVTGGASGIGRSLARAFAEAGMRVAIADVDAAGAEALATEIRSGGGSAMAFGCDVSRYEEVEALSSGVHDRLGSVGVLCNNAGVGGGIGPPMAEVRGDDWERVLGVNQVGVVHGVRAFVPRMIEASAGGHIINTASMAAFLPSAGAGPYTTTKFAVVGLSEVLRAELAPHGIGVSALCPGPYDTGIWGSDQNSDPGEAPDVLGPRVLAAVEANEPFVFTHPEFARAVGDRFEEILRQLRGAGEAIERAKASLRRPSVRQGE